MARRESDTKKKYDPEISDAWRELVAATQDEGGTAIIWRKDRGKDVWLDTIGVSAIADDPHQYLRSCYGGGEFKLRLKNASGTFIADSIAHLQISGPPIDHDKTEAADHEQGADLLRQLDSARGDNTAIMLAMIHEQNENRRSSESSRINPVEMATALVGALAPIVTALLDRKQEPAPAPTMQENIETMTAMMGLAQQMSGNDSGLGSLVGALAAPIAKLVDAGTSGAAPVAQPPEGAPIDRPPWFAIFGPVIPALLGWARAGKDPQLRAELVLDELADEQLGLVHSYLSAEGFSADFFRHVPDAAQTQDWFGAFFDAVLAGIDYEPPAELAPGKPEGDGREPRAEPGSEPRAEPDEYETDGDRAVGELRDEVAERGVAGGESPG